MRHCAWQSSAGKGPSLAGRQAPPELSRRDPVKRRAVEVEKPFVLGEKHQEAALGASGRLPPRSVGPTCEGLGCRPIGKANLTMLQVTVVSAGMASLLPLSRALGDKASIGSKIRWFLA